MSWKHSCLVVLMLGAGRGQADFQDDLLRKFASKNQSTALNLKREIEENLQYAASPGERKPKHFLDVLHRNLRQLEDDSHLPREDRLRLMQQVQDSLGVLKEELARMTPVPPVVPVPIAKQDRDATDPSRPPRRQVAQFAGTRTSSVQLTPVVSPGRRYVRISVSGMFGFFRIR